MGDCKMSFVHEASCLEKPDHRSRDSYDDKAERNQPLTSNVPWRSAKQKTFVVSQSDTALGQLHGHPKGIYITRLPSPRTRNRKCLIEILLLH